MKSSFRRYNYPNLIVNFFSDLLSRKSVTYTYRLPGDVIQTDVVDALSKSGGFFSEKDFMGKFYSNATFTMRTISPWFTYGLVYSSTLLGSIKSIDAEHGQIRLRFKSSLALKVMAILLICFGLIQLGQSLIQTSRQSLSWGISMIVLGPMFCNWFAGISNSGVQERYEIRIHKRLKQKSQRLT